MAHFAEEWGVPVSIGVATHFQQVRAVPSSKLAALQHTRQRLGVLPLVLLKLLDQTGRSLLQLHVKSICGIEGCVQGGELRLRSCTLPSRDEDVGGQV
jgi:hypothetical protein